jgi:hypothetical protein
MGHGSSEFLRLCSYHINHVPLSCLYFLSRKHIKYCIIIFSDEFFKEKPAPIFPFLFDFSFVFVQGAIVKEFLNHSSFYS